MFFNSCCLLLTPFPLPFILYYQYTLLFWANGHTGRHFMSTIMQQLPWDGRACYSLNGWVWPVIKCPLIWGFFHFCGGKKAKCTLKGSKETCQTPILGCHLTIVLIGQPYIYQKGYFLIRFLAHLYYFVRNSVYI